MAIVGGTGLAALGETKAKTEKAKGDEGGFEAGRPRPSLKKQGNKTKAEMERQKVRSKAAESASKANLRR
jgi:hypothetical protein